MIRIGIVGTGRIAKRFVDDAWQGLDVEITAVYNPNMESAKRFCDECGLSNVSENWDEFVADIDAAYVASPLHTHFYYTEKLLKARKHVLCEKPMVISRDQSLRAFRLAEENNCVLMEGIKTAYSPGFKKTIELVQSGCIGEIIDVEACFTKLVEPGLREWTHVEDCGSMTELGTYGCFAVTKLLGTNYSNWRYTSIRDKNGVDKFTKVFFEYGDTTTGLVKAGIGVKSEGELILSGTNGYILVRAPWWMPTQIEVHYEDASKTEVYNTEFNGNGLQYELEYFVKQIQNNILVDEETKNQSITIASIMEEFINSEIGYRTKVI